MKSAAAVIRNDNNQFVSQKKCYPPSDRILDNIDDEIPSKLKYFLQEIILRDKKYNLESCEKKLP